jgi:hypothetical protein
MHSVKTVLLCSIIRLIVALMAEAASTSKTSVDFYQPTRANNPEDSHLYTVLCDDLKSHLVAHFITINVS